MSVEVTSKSSLKYFRRNVSVAESIIRLLTDIVQNDTSYVTVFHFVGVFKGRHFEPYIENMGHDAWMVTLLDTEQVSKVIQVVDRLANVPVVPPLESLKHLGVLLARGDLSIAIVIGEPNDFSFVTKRNFQSSIFVVLEVTFFPISFLLTFVFLKMRTLTLALVL